MTLLVSDMLLRGKSDELEDEEERMGTISPKLRKEIATFDGIL